MNVVELKQTCSSCPSQWEGKVDDGRMIYIRYRWGGLSVRVSKDVTDDVKDAVNGIDLLDESVGGDFDGTMTTQEMMRWTHAILNFKI